MNKAIRWRLLPHDAHHPKWWQLLCFVLISVFAQLIFPLLGSALASVPFFLVCLVLINPIVSLVLCGWLSLSSGFVWYLPIINAVIFLPVALLLYNSSAFIYALLYLIFGFIGLTIGNLIYRVQTSTKV